MTTLDRKTKRWRKLLRAFDSNCLYCGKYSDEMTTDHIIPISKGGSNSILNLALVCGWCNSHRESLTIVEFIRKFDLNAEDIVKRWRVAVFRLELIRVRARKQDSVPKFKTGFLTNEEIDQQAKIQKKIIQEIENYILSD